jgi:hypothetical protein
LHLNWRTGNGALDDFLCISRSEYNSEDFISGWAPVCSKQRMGAGIYALYRLHCTLRYSYIPVCDRFDAFDRYAKDSFR